MPSNIEDYALIGDCQTRSIGGPDGSIDWLCFPRFDSAACFAALLGTPEHGRWLLAPAAEARRIRRRYRPGTLVLETEYETDAGLVRLIDFMPPRTGTPELIRIVEGDAGRSSDADGTRHPVRLRIGRPVGSTFGTTASGPPLDRRRCTAGPARSFTVRDFTRSAISPLRRRQWLPFELAWSPTHHDEPEPTDPVQSLQRNRIVVDGVVGPMHVPRRVARRRRAVAHHAQGTDVRAYRWNRCRRHDVPARAHRRRTELGLSGTAGCEMPRSRSTR